MVDLGTDIGYNILGTDYPEYYLRQMLNQLELPYLVIINDPERYGVVGFDLKGNVNSIIEKPSKPASNYAITGLYFVDGTASERAKTVKPSARGELEITSLLESYLKEDKLSLEKMGRGFAWLDAGTPGSLLDAGNFVRALTERQGLQELTR